MPPKRRREDSEFESDSTGSLAMHEKELNASGTELRRSNRTKPNGKLQTYSDIQNAELRSISEESSNSNQPSGSEELSSSEWQSSGEDEIHPNTDQGASDQADLADASSSSGSENQSNIGDDEDTPVQAVEQDGDKIWETLDGDQRTSMKVGARSYSTISGTLRYLTTTVRSLTVMTLHLIWVHSHLVPDLKEYADVRSDPSRASHDAHDREKAQKKLLEARRK